MQPYYACSGRGRTDDGDSLADEYAEGVQEGGLCIEVFGVWCLVFGALRLWPVCSVWCLVFGALHLWPVCGVWFFVFRALRLWLLWVI